MNFSTISAVVMDMDGVLWRGDEGLPGLAAFFDFLRARSLPYLLATNNASKTQAAYVEKLARLGVNGVKESEIITSGTATVDYLREHFPANATIHVLGSDGLRQVLTEAGYTLSEGDAQVVVCGVDWMLTYEKLKWAMRAVLNGAVFIATNVDSTYPTPDGLVPGAGSIVAALRTASGCEPIIIGKPEKPLFETSLKLLGTAPENTLMIGDRLETDIVGAKLLGLQTALVLTGISTRAEAAASPVLPDGVYDDLPALMQAWEIEV
jgi:4-nitrophenyl phosphatase